MCFVFAVLVWCQAPSAARADDEHGGTDDEWVCVYETDRNAYYDKDDYTREEATEDCELEFDALCVCGHADAVYDNVGWEAWICETDDGDEVLEYLKSEFTEDQARDECEDDTGRDCECDD